MITQKLIQRVQELINDYNQTHEGQFAIIYRNDTYRLTHSDVPSFELFINYFDLSKNADDEHIQNVFETVIKLIAIYKALNETFQAQRPYFYKDCIGIHKANHRTILKPSSEGKVTIEQTYMPTLTEISFTKDDVDILVIPNGTYNWMDAYYTAKADVPLDELNSTIKALQEKTENASVFK